MTEITYAGENLLAGNLGRIAIYIAIITGLLALYFYIKVIKAPQSNKLKYRNYGRLFYYLQTFSVVMISAILLYLILGHHFEYAYVFKHSSKLMPAKYIISSFWAGQEGSFLLWAFLIAVFGIGALHTSKRLEGGVMAVVSASIVFLMTMIIGVNFLGIKLGSNPFDLLRLVEANLSEPFFKNPNYLQFLMDGNGLNPLLENPWMVIHPPMLFMGYASALFPFAYAFASLIENDKRYWIKLTIPWILLSVGLLGIGLILGGAWAYQSLTFGGFWAWDPVENASLVPWLVLVAALHYMLMTYKRDKYYWGTYIFTFSAFLTVVYASYLTRSGVLGETSVHAFGDNGLTFQLVAFMLVFTAAPLWMLIKRRNSLPSSDLPNLINREFMMMYGSVIILLSAFQVVSTTSLPVFNKLFGSNAALASDVTGFYNSWQTPFAILIAVLLGAAHYLNYDNNDTRSFWKRIMYPTIIALVLAITGFIIDSDMTVVHGIFLFAIIFAITSSVAYLFKFISKHRNLAAGLTHLGFTIFLFGVLITFSNTITFTSDASVATRGNNVMLFKGQVKKVGDQLMRYSESRFERDEIFYQVDFLEQNASGENTVKYSVFPSVKYNDRMGNVHNPDTRNLLRGDIFMYLTFAEDRNKRAADGYSVTETYDLALHDTLFAERKPVVLDSIQVEMLDATGANFKITALMNTTDSLNKPVIQPMTLTLKGNELESGIIAVPGTDSKLRFDNVAEVANSIKVSLLEKEPEFIVLKIMFFPWIFMLWGGAIIMFAGVSVAVYKRAVRAREV
ncbi:MAG TPA: cytochrome c biogenesis protein CcsA [Lentimicrobium sp.]|nr:cytochrome c biogenesis protein CcsA [Lentimicrobium sp.]